MTFAQVSASGGYIVSSISGLITAAGSTINGVGTNANMQFGIVGGDVAHALVFIVAILVGAVVAGIAGLLVGIPSLRLRGDYLAIVTLGFAEIIRIVILNIDKVGGAIGFTVPGYANFVWVGIFAIITIIIVYKQNDRMLKRPILKVAQ